VSPAAAQDPAYRAAFSLDKLAAVRERGVKGKLAACQVLGCGKADTRSVFSSSLVNGFDLTFMVIYAVYLSARVYGFWQHDAEALRLGANWLAIGMIPCPPLRRIS
jgi:hypothetical protein